MSTEMKIEPQREHEWLHKLVGEWTSEMEATMEPGKPPEKCTGTERVRSLGGLWIVGEGQGEMPGGGLATMILTLGYDPARKRYVGTWIGSMMSHLWVYDGPWMRRSARWRSRPRGPAWPATGRWRTTAT